MIEAGRFVAAARARGFALYAGVPCSYLTPFINHVLADASGAVDATRLRYIGAANEGDAVAIAAGAELGGLRSVAMLQNSGLGNAVNPLTSLTWTFRIPVLLVVTWRGEPGGPQDEPQHELMGRITPRMLELMDVPWAPFPVVEAEIGPALDAACAWFAREGRPYALVMRKGSVAEDGNTAPEPRHRPRGAPRGMEARPRATRRQALAAIQAALGPDDVLVATTGYTGRELYALGDRPGQLYMVGSMGCAVSLGLGLATARPDRRIVVVDGDGAALMRLGALATVGAERPPNLLHVVLDNGMHESTGGQATVSANVDFCALATASGYPEAFAVGDPEALREQMERRVAGLRFVHVPIRPGVTGPLPRPTVTPAEVAARLRAHLGPRRAPAP
jgi:phosphonopyruvate decarboxylase